MRCIYSSFKRRVKLKSTLQKLIFSSVSILMAILFLAGIILYGGYKKQIISQSAVVSEKLLRQADYYSEYTLRWAVSYIYQLYLDKDIYKLVFNKHNNPHDINTGINRIRLAADIHPSIQSVYVYNDGEGMIYPSDGDPSASSEFYDRDIERVFKENEETISTKFIPRKIKGHLNGREYIKDVLTIVLSNIKNSENSMPYGAIVINLDADDVQNYYKNITEEGYSVMAIDGTGRIVLNSGRGLFLQDVSANGYIQRVLGSDSTGGSFFSTVNGKPSIVTYSADSRIGLKFINTIPYETLADSMNSMISLLASTALLLLPAGILSAFVLFKRIYAPVERAIKTIREFFKAYGPREEQPGLNEKGEKDEDYLAKVIDIIISRPLVLKSLSGTDLNFIKRQLLKGLLLNTPFEINAFKSKLKELEVDIDFNHIEVILFKIDFYDKFINNYSKAECEKLKESMCEEAHKIMKEGRYKNEVVTAGEDEFCIILSLGGKKDGPEGEVIRLVEDVQKAVYRKYGASISAAIGDYAESIADTSGSYRSCGEYMRYRFKYGPAAIAYSAGIKAGICLSIGDCKAQEEAVFKELRVGNAGRVKIELDKLFEYIGQLSYNDMVTTITQVFEGSRAIIGDMLRMNGISALPYLRKFPEDMKMLATAQEVKDYLFELYSDTLGQLKEKKKTRKNEVIESVKNFINKNYSDELLSLENIAEKLKLSPNYLRMLFKEAEGKSLSGYINEVRFKYARALLESTEFTVAEISARVGFSNDNYFYTAFKKFYGVSPNYYRHYVNNTDCTLPFGN